MNYPQWRPRNETADDLENEKRTAEILRSKFNLNTHKLSEALYGFDWAVTKGDELVAFAEFKQRRMKYDTLLLSAAKFEQGARYAATFGVPFVLFIRWPDGLFSFRFTTDFVPKLAMGGNSRGQNGDIEPCVHIPVEMFQRIAE